MSAAKTIAEITSPNAVSPEQVAAVLAKTCPAEGYCGKRVLLIIPDGTRTAPVGMVFKTLFAQIGSSASAMDVLIALGTHQPMSEEAICGRLDISLAQRRGAYAKVKFFNHEWNNPAALKNIGIIP